MKRVTYGLLSAAAWAFTSLGAMAATPAPSSASVATPAVSASVVVPAASASVAIKPDAITPKTRLAAVNQYQHDLVSVLALRGDALHLLGAALLARPLHSEQALLGFHALLTRALKADDANAATHWASLSDCQAEACPNQQALEALTKMDADNAAVWLLRMDLALRDNDMDAARADLLKAADAKRYDDYAGSSLQALIAAVTALPVPPATLRDYVGHSNAGPASVQTFLAFSIANAHPRPNLIPASQWCDPAHAPKAAGDIHDACLKLAHVLLWGSSVQSRAAGLHMRGVLDADPAAQQEADDAQHDLAWQWRNYSQLALKAMNDESVAAQMLKLAHNGGTDMSLMTALLRQYHIALHEPDRAAKTPAATLPAAASTR
ncbi:MAG: hypothetical protein L0H70_06145 [Xanthomonadales bacterium]|nr:hypothetical protein [Xanthomonadales bacterium]